MDEYYEQMVVLQVRIPREDIEEGMVFAPSVWDWNDPCDMPAPDAIEVLASGALIGPNK